MLKRHWTLTTIVGTVGSFIVLFTLIGTALYLSVNIKSAKAQTVQPRNLAEAAMQNIVFKDPATGCEYLQLNSTVPRMDGNGKQRGCFSNTR